MKDTAKLHGFTLKTQLNWKPKQVRFFYKTDWVMNQAEIIITVVWTEQIPKRQLFSLETTTFFTQDHFEWKQFCKVFSRGYKKINKYLELLNSKIRWKNYYIPWTFEFKWYDIVQFYFCFYYLVWFWILVRNDYCLSLNQDSDSSDSVSFIEKSERSYERDIWKRERNPYWSWYCCHPWQTDLWQTQRVFEFSLEI